mgnify:FL=1
MKNKALPHEANEAARAVLRAIIDRDFKGHSSHWAKAAGVSPAVTSDFLNGGAGAGMKLLRAISSSSGLPIEELLGGAATGPVVLRESTEPTFGEHPEWVAAVQETLKGVYGKPRRL